MANPVRLRGSVGERRRHLEHTGMENGIGGPGYTLRVVDGPRASLDVIRTDRRVGPPDRRGSIPLDAAQVAARVEECIAVAREPLLRLIEEQASEIARLKAEARLLTSLVRDEDALAKGQPEGCHE